jgi:hypothetical protein
LEEEKNYADICSSVFFLNSVPEKKKIEGKCPTLKSVVI